MANIFGATIEYDYNDVLLRTVIGEYTLGYANCNSRYAPLNTALKDVKLVDHVEKRQHILLPDREIHHQSLQPVPIMLELVNGKYIDIINRREYNIKKDNTYVPYYPSITLNNFMGMENSVVASHLRGFSQEDYRRYCSKIDLINRQFISTYNSYIAKQKKELQEKNRIEEESQRLIREFKKKYR